MADAPSGSGSGSGAPPPPKAIPSLAKKPSDVTRQGASKLKFVPTLPQRRKKEEVKTEPTPAIVPSTASKDGARGRGGGRGFEGRGRGSGRGRGRGGAPPEVTMTASGPFAMGPTLAGSGASRRSTPRSNFAPSIASSNSGSSTLGAGLSQTAPPTLRKDLNDLKGKGKEVKVEDEDVEVYSDPDDGVEIIDIDQVRGMDYMAPESLRRERKKVKKEKKTEEPGDVDVANALDLSESEEEEEAELEDVIEDFAAQVNIDSGDELREEKLYLFQFPAPFPTFVQEAKSSETGGGDVEMSDSTKKVTFGPDVKPAADATPISRTASAVASDPNEPAVQPLDGVIGRLEIYRSGAVKIRLANDILLDVNPATQPSFLQQVVHVDMDQKRIVVLGEINKQFVASPNVDALLNALEQAEKKPQATGMEGEEKLLTMS